jgi:hypothetical protein
MKIRLLLLVVISVGGLGAAVSLIRAGDEKDGHNKHHKLWELLGSLSGDEQAKFRAARKQAMENPEVMAAHERRKKADAEYRELLDREMLRIDPSLKSLIEKTSQLRQHADF